MTEQNSNTNSQNPSRLPWYKEGLRFKCTECGKCCTGPSGFVWIDEEEMKGMAAILNISLELFKRKYVRQCNNRHALVEKKSPNGDYDCIFLKDKKCLVYQARPSQCRTFPWWQENLNTEQSWKLAAENCEGIHDEAPLVPYEQIIQLLQLNKKKE